MQKMKMPIITSVIVIALIAAGLGMGTMAYFSDTDTSTNTVFTAGEMLVEVGAVFSSDGLTYSNLQPGDVITGGMPVTNIGTLDGDLWGRTMYTDVWTPGGYKLSDKLMLTEMTLDLVSIWLPPGGIPLSAYGNLGWESFGSLNQGATVTFRSTSIFDIGAGNNYQNTRTRVWFEVLLTQVGISPSASGY